MHANGDENHLASSGALDDVFLQHEQGKKK